MHGTRAVWPWFAFLLPACGGGYAKCPDTHVEAHVTHAARPHDGHAHHEASHWRGHASAVEVKAVRARVRVERADEDAIDIAARPQQDDGEEPLAIEQHGDTVVVRELGRASIDIHVPRGVAVRITTVSGPIDARALDGELEARTVSGPIKARVVGADPHKQIALHTVSGPVLVDFADGASAHVHVETVRGHIAGARAHRHDDDDDDEDEDERHGDDRRGDDRRRRSYDARVGDGAGEVRVDTVTGPVKLRNARRRSRD